MFDAVRRLGGLNMFGRVRLALPSRHEALSGRSKAMPVPERHSVLGTSLLGPFPQGSERAIFGMGCFWGAERLFWQLDGVITTAVGYSGGYTPNPTYEETCSGQTGHTEVVLVVFDPKVITYHDLTKTFWENHDPTQGMRQGNDVGTQYRSALYYTNENQRQIALATKAAYNEELSRAGYSTITTEIDNAGPFYYAEAFHQQYLHKNPFGYCGIAGTGVSCPVGLAT